MKWMCRLSLSVVLMCASRASAIGWGPTDFLITGAPNFPDRIGVFDQNFAFKGYLDQNFLGVRGMDFDAQGRLVAVSFLNPEVRVYNPDGTRAGGFTLATSPVLESGGDLKVAPDGNYALGTISNGVRVFTPQGRFVRQYGSGGGGGVTFVPGDRLWVGGVGNTVKIFDTGTGAEVGTFTAGGQVNSGGLRYYSSTNSVLMVDGDRDAGGVYERDLTGALLQQYHIPIAQTNCNGASLGPGNDLFGTTNDLFVDVVHWHSDGGVAGTFNIYPSTTVPGGILWAGLVPEPEATVFLIAMAWVLAAERRTLRI
jgi:hypothetical protein